MAHDSYEHPLTGRYAAREMRELFGNRRRFGLWRRLWLALAEAQRELGLTQISESALHQMRESLDPTDEQLARAAEYETQLRHDVMAHVHAFGDAAPAARGVIHLGATSCFVTDNADLILMREAMALLIPKLRGAIAALADFAGREAATPCLGSTHFQVAQLTTVGKRACLWLQDLVADYHELRRLHDSMPLRGVKGTTGTQASFLELFEGDAARVLELERRVCAKMGFNGAFAVTGQTYPRKYDYSVLSALAGLGISAQKMATDIRLLMGQGELSEPFEEKQVGSSAMAYKQNPMRSERVCSIARWLINLPQNAAFTGAEQWLERTLDDSANRRMSIPEAFLSADVILRLLQNISTGLRPNHNVIATRVTRELPLMATEAVIMAAVRAGTDRQRAHEAIRVHSLAAVQRMREGVADNDLMARLKGDALFAPIKESLDGLLDPARFVGLAPEQARAYVDQHVKPVLAQGASSKGETVIV